MDREPVSARTTLDRERTAGEVLELRAQVRRLETTIVGLGAIVAEAHAAGFVRTHAENGRSAHGPRD